MNGKSRPTGPEILARIAAMPAPDAPTPSEAGRRLTRRLALRDALGWLARLWAALARLLAPWLARATIAHASASRNPMNDKEDRP